METYSYYLINLTFCLVLSLFLIEFFVLSSLIFRRHLILKTSMKRRLIPFEIKRMYIFSYSFYKHPLVYIFIIFNTFFFGDSKNILLPSKTVLRTLNITYKSKSIKKFIHKRSISFVSPKLFKIICTRTSVLVLLTSENLTI